MDLTEEQKQTMNSQVEQLPIIKRLKSQDEEIISDLESLKEGQEDLKGFVESGFTKGKATMAEHSEEIADLREEVADVKKDIADLKHVMTAQHQEVINVVKEKETEALTNKLKDMIEDKRTTENRIWDILKIISALLIAAAFGYIGITGG